MLPPVRALIVTVLVAETWLVAMVNVPVSLPLGITIETGTRASKGSLLARVTVVVPAVPFSVTVPIDVAPPAILVGKRTSESTDRSVVAFGDTVRVAVRVIDPSEAEVCVRQVPERADRVVRRGGALADLLHQTPDGGLVHAPILAGRERSGS